MIKSYKDLKVYQMSFELANEIYWTSRSFPKEEIYSLTSQLLRSSRSVVANIVEGWSKREYENTFKRHLIDSLGSCNETILWLEFSLEYKYLEESIFSAYNERCIEISKMLSKLHDNWKKF
jgi:four helix bundle protein